MVVLTLRHAVRAREIAFDHVRMLTLVTVDLGVVHTIKHTKYEKTDGDKRMIVEYNCDEAEINKASINMEPAIELPAPKSAPEPIETAFAAK